MTADSITELPRAVDNSREVRARLAGSEPAVFLDYDGTLTPIVDDPAQARLREATRRAVDRLAATCAVSVVSGRDLEDVRSFVDLPGIHYAGSHGFDILTADGQHIRRGTEHLPALDAAEAKLRDRLRQVAGAAVERKGFAIAVHYRGVEDADVPVIEEIVTEAAADHEGLRTTGGKRILELRPDIDWDKGRALRLLLDTLGLDGDGVVPIYVGDDLTDEDAFEAIAEDGLGLVVAGEDDQRPTAADYVFADPGEVGAFLDELAAFLEERG